MKASLAKARVNKYKVPRTNEEILKEIKLLSDLGCCNLSIPNAGPKLANSVMKYFADELGYNVTIFNPKSKEAEIEITW